MTISDIITNYRADKKLSLRQLSKKTGISHSYLSSLEKNFDYTTKKASAPSFEVVKKLAAGLKIPIDDFVDMLDDDQLITIDYKDDELFDDELLNKISNIEDRNSVKSLLEKMSEMSGDDIEKILQIADIILKDKGNNIK